MNDHDKRASVFHNRENPEFRKYGIVLMAALAYGS